METAPADHANRLKSLIDTGTEETVIKYREILRCEKKCDLPVPAAIAGGLLQYAHRLRASSMTYCQAVLWIKSLLAVIENGNMNCLIKRWQGSTCNLKLQRKKIYLS
jgi:hypothetical protein